MFRLKTKKLIPHLMRDIFYITYISMKILIVDDSKKCVMWHESAIKEIFNDEVVIEKAYSAREGLEKLTASIDEPYNYIFTDMQMEPDFLPLYAGEWFVKQIKFFKLIIHISLLLEY